MPRAARTAFVSIVASLAAIAATLTAKGTPAAATTEPSSLAAGSCLYASDTRDTPGSYLRSANGVFTLRVFGLVVQLEELRDTGVRITGITTWRQDASSSSDESGRLCMQRDGNLVLYRPDGGVVWQSRTSGTGSSNRVVMQSDGNIVVYTASGRVAWASRTTRAIFVGGDQLRAGSTVVNRYGPRLGLPVATFSMQQDGNLVLRLGSTAVWTSNTHVAGSHLVVQRDGNVVVYSPSSKALWASRTSGSGVALVLLPCRVEISIGAGGVVRSFGRTC